ncbi:MAG: helix-turn-helix domain-containing protein [Chloroflexi bacterium]|jgi:transcriptional regulator with XRE-family HTH domain|nr:XRE family transcriptional regulator [Anaerolineaceae bacterium]NMB89688.1 helix-turn-helix domain-containing protein [Chloroflexota bacterium]
MKHEDHNVGARLKYRRQEIGISLRKLAQTTGLTASFLSQVEHGKANLSLNSLHRLAEAMDVPLLYFLSDHGGIPEEVSPPDEEVVPATVFTPVMSIEERPQLILPLSGVVYELLVPNLGRKMVALCGRLAPGTDNVARRLHESTEEFIYVLSGRLLIGLESGEYILNAGETIYFEGEKLRKLACGSTDQEAVWVSVITPAIF